MQDLLRNCSNSFENSLTVPFFFTMPRRILAFITLELSRGGNSKGYGRHQWSRWNVVEQLLIEKHWLVLLFLSSWTFHQRQQTPTTGILAAMGIRTETAWRTKPWTANLPLGHIFRTWEGVLEKHTACPGTPRKQQRVQNVSTVGSLLEGSCCLRPCYSVLTIDTFCLMKPWTA